VKQRTAELIAEAKRRLVKEHREADALGQMLRWFTGETNQRVGDLLREHNSPGVDLSRILAAESLHRPGPSCHLITRFNSQPPGNRASLETSAVRELSTGIPTAELVSSKRLREIELQFDVEAMGGGASDEG